MNTTIDEGLGRLVVGLHVENDEPDVFLIVLPQRCRLKQFTLQPNATVSGADEVVTVSKAGSTIGVGGVASGSAAFSRTVIPAKTLVSYNDANNNFAEGEVCRFALNGASGADDWWLLAEFELQS